MLYAASYLRHSKYINYPVVGVSQSQAERYSKWRSDRVFEGYLIKYKIIKFDTLISKANHFTTEKYFDGTLTNVISTKKVSFYPVYRLPTIDEANIISSYSDAVDIKIDSDCKAYLSTPQIDIHPCVNDTIRMDPTRIVSMACNSKDQKIIYNLEGNVAEWVAEKNTTVGKGWKDHSKSMSSTTTAHVTTPNAWTGFRNVCEWRPWNERSQ